VSKVQRGPGRGWPIRRDAAVTEFRRSGDRRRHARNSVGDNRLAKTELYAITIPSAELSQRVARNWPGGREWALWEPVAQTWDRGKFFIWIHRNPL